MSKVHPLTKLQFLLAILWAIPFCLLTSVEESRQSILLFLGIIPFIGLSVISIYLGWLMAVKKEDIISPLESLGIRFTEKFRGKQAAKNLMLEYSKPSRKMLIGGIRIEKFINSVTPTILGEQEPKHDYRANHTSM